MKRQVFPIIGTIITLAQQSSICESYVLVMVVGRASAILYNLVAMWPLDLAFMFTSKVCIEDEYETIAFSPTFPHCFCCCSSKNLCQTELLYVAASCSGQEGFSQHVTSKNKELVSQRSFCNT